MVALGLISLLGTSCRSKSEVSSATSAASASVAAPSANASDSCARQQLVVMSYNVENFFNPEDDPLKNDDEFTPMTSDGGPDLTRPRTIITRIHTSDGIILPIIETDESLRTLQSSDDIGQPDHMGES